MAGWLSQISVLLQLGFMDQQIGRQAGREVGVLAWTARVVSGSLAERAVLIRVEMGGTGNCLEGGMGG